MVGMDWILTGEMMTSSLSGHIDVSLFHGHLQLGDDTLTLTEVNFQGHKI